MKFNIILFNNFETLDVFGPVEIFGHMNLVDLEYFSMEGGIITNKDNVKIVTKSFKEIDLEGVLFVPGGFGTRALVYDQSFIESLKYLAEKAPYIFSVCTGSALLAKTGILADKKATSNKIALDWVKSLNHTVLWRESARWVKDGNIYTSSGVSAGMDMALGFIEDICKRDKAEEIAQHIEYIWNRDRNYDPFAL